MRNPSGLKMPYSMAIGDKDFVMGKGQALQTEATLKQQVGEPEENEYEIKVYPGCRHGVSGDFSVSTIGANSSTSSLRFGRSRTTGRS